MTRVLRYAPWLALGPVTGPLAGLAVHYARRGRWGMAAVCCAGVAEVWVLVPALLSLELTFLARL